MQLNDDKYFDFIQKGLNLSRKLLANSHIVIEDKKTSKGALMSLLESFTDCVAYLEGRRVKAKTFELVSEAAVQDLLFIMLKPNFPELTFEDPSAKSAASYAIKDLYLPSMKLVLEVKYIYTREDVKGIEKQLADDIWKYSNNPDCEDLIFFIYDRNLYIPDRKNFISKMSRDSGEFINQGRPILIQTIIKP